MPEDLMSHAGGGNGGDASLRPGTVGYQEMCWRHDEQIKTLMRCQGNMESDMKELKEEVLKLPSEIDRRVQKETGKLLNKFNQVLVAALMVLLALALNLYFRQ